MAIKIEHLEKTKQELTKLNSDLKDRHDKLKDFKVNNFSLLNSKSNNSINDELEMLKVLQSNLQRQEKLSLNLQQDLNTRQNKIEELTKELKNCKDLIISRDHTINQMKNSLNNSEASNKNLQNNKVTLEYEKVNLTNENKRLQKLTLNMNKENIDIRQNIQNSIQESQKLIAQTNKT